jgi:hypothetical protein
LTTTADIEEVEREFRRYFMTGPVLDDWAAWANLFTDDATYYDHFYGTFTTFTGPDEITKFLEGTMGAAPQVYSPLIFYVIDGTRVALQGRQPRRQSRARRTAHRLPLLPIHRVRRRR